LGAQLRPSARANALRALILGVASLLLFTARLGTPSYIFDELYYVPSARALLHGTVDPSPGHPPLGKELIAISMKTFGDNPFGWRFSSALAGAISVVGVFYLALLLLDSASLGLLAAVLTVLNNFTFVMARVAMAEVFIIMFAVTGVAAWLAAVKGINPGRMLALAGVLLGCAVAVKWSAAVILAVVGATTLVLWIRKQRYVGMLYAAFCICFVPVFTYYLSYWPLCHSQHVALSISQVASSAKFILELHHHAPGDLAINSFWYQWVFRTDPERALNYMVGNWAVCWLGLVALLFCAYRFVKKPALAEGIVIALYAGSLFQWAIIRRPFTYYYYYSIAATFLCLAIPTALRRSPDYRVSGVRVSLVCVVAAAVIFLVFYPKMTSLEAPWDCAIVCIS
jgi:dolichyl-phosphate-mannose-protein mannosyltransferase